MTVQKTAPLIASIDEVRNVPWLVRRRVERDPSHASFSVLRDKQYVDVSAGAFLEDVISVAKGLIAAGIKPGDHVAVMSATRYEWTIVDFGTMFAGGIVVPIYETSSPDQVAFILADSDTVLAFGESRRHQKLLTQAAEQANHQVTHGIWSMTGEGDHTLAALRAGGKDVPDEVVREREQIAGPESIASLVYTSGTVADPRGASITHANLTHLAVNTVKEMESVLGESSATVLLLPLAHILARFIQLAFFWGGGKMTHMRDASRITAILGSAQPTIMIVVPRVMGKVLAGVRKGADEKHLGKLFDRAEDVAVQYAKYTEALNAGRPAKLSLAVRAQYKLFDKLFYSRIRQTLGGRLRYMVSGAAPLDARLAYFFCGIGVEILEGYGMTETTAPITVNRPGQVQIGTVGQLIPGSSIRIGEDGEILAKGLGVFAGYHNAKKSEDFTQDGYLHTGDLGSFDEADRLVITGRAKDMIITDAGKNISPQRWQGEVERSGMFAHAVVVGDRRPHPTALLVIDPVWLKDWATKNTKPELQIDPESVPAVPGRVIEDAELRAVIDPIVEAANRGGSHAERIDTYTVVLADVSEDGGYQTPTMKLKRLKFIDDMAPVIEKMYR